MVDTSGQPQLITLPPVTVDYEASVERLARLGRYGYVDPSIKSAIFPTTRQGQAQLEPILVHFGRRFESDDAVTELDKMGLRAGELHELLALGAEHPNEQRMSPIAALGSVVGQLGGRRFACLNGWGGDRRIDLNIWCGSWSDIWRFLAFPKQAAPNP